MFYNRLKKLLPSKIRLAVKPYYQKWYLRGFTSQSVVAVHDGGQKFQLVLDRTNGAVDEYIYIHRNWETHVGESLRELLEAGNTFIDVGANIGYFSLLAGLMVGKSGRVIAFEPLPQLVRQVQQSADLNEFLQIDVRQCALGDNTDTMQIILSANNIGGSSLVSTGSGESVEVQVRTLDSELADIERIDMMKIDVEGFEYETLCGAKEIIAKHRPVLLIEFSPHMYAKRSASMASDIARLLVEFGYQFKVLQTGRVCNTAESLLEATGMSQVDLLCTIEK